MMRAIDNVSGGCQCLMVDPLLPTSNFISVHIIPFRFTLFQFTPFQSIQFRFILISLFIILAEKAPVEIERQVAVERLEDKAFSRWDGLLLDGIQVGQTVRQKRGA